MGETLINGQKFDKFVSVSWIILTNSKLSLIIDYKFKKFTVYSNNYILSVGRYLRLKLFYMYLPNGMSLLPTSGKYCN